MVNNEISNRYEKLRADKLEDSLKETKERLQELEEALEAIRNGTVDGLVRRTPSGNQIFMLKGSEQPYRELIEEMNEGAILLSDNDTILYCNQGFANLVDAPLERIIGRNIADWFSQSSSNSSKELISSVKKETGKRVFDIAFQTTKKQLIPTHVSINKISTGSIKASALIITDLTRHMSDDVRSYTANLEHEIKEREKAEEALIQSEKKYRRLFETSQDGIMARDLQGHMIDCNQAYADMLGYTKKELAKLSVKRLICKKWLEQRERINKQVLETGESVIFERQYKRKNGSIFSASVRTWRLMDEKDKVIGVWSIVRDIIEQVELRYKLEEHTKNLEEIVKERTMKLESSALYARSLIEASVDPLLTINIEGKITDVNRATELVTGCSKEELIGSDFSDYFTEPEHAREGYKQVFIEGHVEDYPLIIKSKSGNLTYVLYNAALYKNGVGEIQGVFAAARDITKRRKAEMQAKEAEAKLKENERLAAIGATAGMVGHDLRNPLQTIVSDVYLMKLGLKAMPEGEERENLRESLERLQNQVIYMDKIVSDLQAFVKPIEISQQIINLNELITSTILQLSIPKIIQTNIQVENNLEINTDPQLLRRVLFNLITNALQAMPHGGELNIKAYKDDNQVQVIVEDTGIGIPDEIKPKRARATCSL
jgi:PAS domain S-box-containing protein